MNEPLSLRERRRREIRRELAASAIALFAAKGASATTVDQIVASSGCSPSTFFRSFPTKEDAAFFDGAEVLEELRNDCVEGADVWAGIKATLVQAGVDFVQSGDELAMTRLRLFHDDPAIAARYAEVCASREKVIAARFLDELGTGREAEAEAWIRAGAIIAAVRAALRTVAHHGGNLSSELASALDRIEVGFAPPRTNRIENNNTSRAAG